MYPHALSSQSIGFPQFGTPVPQYGSQQSLPLSFPVSSQQGGPMRLPLHQVPLLSVSLAPPEQRGLPVVTFPPTHVPAYFHPEHVGAYLRPAFPNNFNSNNMGLTHIPAPSYISPSALPVFEPQAPVPFRSVDSGPRFFVAQALNAHTPESAVTPGTSSPPTSLAEAPETALPAVPSPAQACAPSFECTFPSCNKVFRSKQGLRRHPATHVERPRYSCTKCDTTFLQKNSLRRHLYFHSHDKPHACPVSGCVKKFADRTNLHTHVVAHRRNPFQCSRPECMKLFPNQSQLELHESRHELPIQAIASFSPPAATSPSSTDAQSKQTALTRVPDSSPSNSR